MIRRHLTIWLLGFILKLFFFIDYSSSNDVSLKLVYVGWVFWWLSLWQFQSHSKLSFIINQIPIYNHFLLFFLHPFNVCVCLYFVFLKFLLYFIIIYLYLVVNLFNESKFHGHFAYQIKNEKKMEQIDI
jgi:hypothetical protein